MRRCAETFRLCRYLSDFATACPVCTLCRALFFSPKNLRNFVKREWKSLKKADFLKKQLVRETNERL
jgi:hypothetical protein